jgi:hypothetical protein
MSLCRIAVLIFLPAALFAQQAARPAHPLTNDHYQSIGINNILMWMSNNGSMAHNPLTDASGLLWPRGTQHNAIFQLGLLFGGKKSGDLHVGGSMYQYGLQAGKILASGVADNPADPRYRVFRARNLSRTEYLALDTATQASLKTDFREWPAEDGAPYIDSNHNGVYDPDFDAWLDDSTASDKPWFIGDELLWSVSNDMDSARTRHLFGTLPAHMEIRTLVWAYRSPAPLNNAVFVKHTLSYRDASSPFDSMYLGVWSDVEIGDADNDYIGYDSTMNMGYGYNGFPIDGVYDNPPAVGIVLLQGPIVPSAGSRAQYNFTRRDGYQNLEPYAFMRGTKGGLFNDPAQSRLEGAMHMYQNLQGRLKDSTLPVDPVSGLSTRFTVAGDPVTGTGWIDGIDYSPGDRRLLLTAGPITMLPGDEQEIVYAIVIAQGGSNLGDVGRLREDARLVRTWYDMVPDRVVPNSLRYRVTYPGVNTVRMRIEAELPSARSARAILKNSRGVPITSFPLFDDGLHGDGAASDHVFAGEWDSTRMLEGADCFVHAVYRNAPEGEWPVGTCIPLCGPAHAAVHAIESDHLNFDHLANPGENIRYSVDVENGTVFPIAQWSVYHDSGYQVYDHPIVIPQAIAPGAIDRRAYDATNPRTYFEHDVPAGAKESDIMLFPVAIRDTNNNCWRDTLAITVNAFGEPPVDSLTVHVAGPASGTLGWRLVDASSLRDHTYRITVQGADSIADKRVTVEDLTEQSVLARDVSIPTCYAHEMPVTDGWKLTLGTAVNRLFDKPAWDEKFPNIRYVPDDRRWLVPNSAFAYGEFFSGSSLGRFDMIPVKIVFSNSEKQNAYDYLRGVSPNYGCIGYYPVPMRAYDMSDSLHPRQVNLAFVEQAGGPTEDHTWMPTTSFTDREYLYVLKSNYSSTPDPRYLQMKIDADAPRMDILYGGWYYKSSPTATFVDGDYFFLTPVVPVSERDTFMVHPRKPVILPPVSNVFELLPSYPNPFGGSAPLPSTGTNIPFSLAHDGHVTLTLYSLLGRKVQTLVDGAFTAGKHEYQFVPVSNFSTGVYVMELVMDDQRLTRRMVYLR